MNINRSLLTKQAKFLASSFVIVLMIALCILIHLQQAAHANRIDDPVPGSTGSENTINTPATPPALETPVLGSTGSENTINTPATPPALETPVLGSTGSENTINTP